MFIPSSLKEPAKMSLQELKTHIQRKDQILPIEEDKEDSDEAFEGGISMEYYENPNDHPELGRWVPPEEGEIPFKY